MSDPMMQRPPMPQGGAPPGGGGMPPGGPSPAGGMPSGGMKSKMSLFNPTDIAAKGAMGDINPNMTVADFLQKNFGVRPEDPLQKLMEATKSQMQNRTMAGKLGAQQPPGGTPPQGAAPPPRPQMPPSGGAGGRPPMGAPPQQGGARSLDDLVNKIG